MSVGSDKKASSTPALDNCFYSLPADEPALDTPTPPTRVCYHVYHVYHTILPRRAETTVTLTMRPQLGDEQTDRKVTEINEAPLRPILAFEKFAGKVLDTSGTGNGRCTNTPTLTHSLPHSQQVYW
jgi:hypothetical protein